MMKEERRSGPRESERRRKRRAAREIRERELGLEGHVQTAVVVAEITVETDRDGGQRTERAVCSWFLLSVLFSSLTGGRRVATKEHVRAKACRYAHVLHNMEERSFSSQARCKRPQTRDERDEPHAPSLAC